MDDPIIISVLVLVWALFFDKPKAIWKMELVDSPPAVPMQPIIIRPGVAVGRSRGTQRDSEPVRLAAPSKPESKRRTGFSTPKRGTDPFGPFSQN